MIVGVSARSLSRTRCSMESLCIDRFEFLIDVRVVEVDASRLGFFGGVLAGPSFELRVSTRRASLANCFLQTMYDATATL